MAAIDIKLPNEKKTSVETNKHLSVILNVLKWIVLMFFAIYAIFPILWLLISSFKTNAELMSEPFGLPAVWQFGNYLNALKASNLGILFANSVFISIAATCINIMLAGMISYCIARFTFKGKEIIFVMFSAGILVPLNALMVPYFTIVNKLGLYDKHIGLIIVYTAIGIPVSTFIVRGFMNGIPREVEEAAIIDGCGFFKRFFMIILPLSKTGLVTAATFQFLTCWNEFVYSMLLTSSTKVRTIQLGIRYFTNQFSTDFVSMYAAIIVSIIPSVICYMLFQEQIISGLTSGAVKG
ncbi:MAG: ABC-type sugar transport system, permease component [Clostridia bacterium]|jgi:raffinose/stachyose/melibiose transport system permease protein|nr:ABC-type sugar transport system, permease component [Clostridia bacterium]